MIAGTSLGLIPTIPPCWPRSMSFNT
jgi:hypothetical protein